MLLLSVSLGYYCPSGTHEQLRCASGQYQDETGQPSCKTCPQGFFCDNTLAPVVLYNNSICAQGKHLLFPNFSWPLSWCKLITDNICMLFCHTCTLYIRFIVIEMTLTLYHTILTFNDPEEEGFGKHCEKRRKCW